MAFGETIYSFLKHNRKKNLQSFSAVIFALKKHWMGGGPTAITFSDYKYWMGMMPQTIICAFISLASK